MIDPKSVPHLPGVPILDVDGDIIGSVDRVYIHQDTGAPLWVSIRTYSDGALDAFAPLDDARFDDQAGAALHVPLPRAVVEDAPLITSTDALTRDDVHALRGYYSGVSTKATAAALGSTRREEKAAPTWSWSAPKSSSTSAPSPSQKNESGSRKSS